MPKVLSYFLIATKMTADTLSLQGKVAIVTGSGRENGIGAGIALAFARNGASVAVNYVSDSSKDRAANVCENLRKAGGQAIAVQAAVDTIEGARDLVNKTLEGFKTDHIDILGMRCSNVLSVLRASQTEPVVDSQQRRHRLLLPDHRRAGCRTISQGLPAERSWSLLYGQ